MSPGCGSLPLFFLLGGRPLAAVALCWPTCGVAPGRRRGADVSGVRGLDFGFAGAARPAAAVAAAVFGPSRAGAAGPRLHEDDGAVVLRAEVGAV